VTLTSEHLSDEDLILRYRSGKDPAGALDELFGRQLPKLALWCLRLTGDRDSAAEMAQEVVVKAYENLDSFRLESKFSTWLYSIARFHCFNRIRHRQAHPESALDEAEAEWLQSPDADPLQVTETVRNRNALSDLIDDELEAVEQQVVRLHYFEDLPLPAITRLLRLENASGAKAYLVSAKRKLQRAVARKGSRVTPPGAGD
jgi:RNA polymerase sigma-70 factor (ECF subfamily)